MLRNGVSRFLMAASLLFSVAVCAQEAYTTRLANVRAGPDSDYPLVAQLAPGTPVTVAGCLSDYRWCDIIYGDIRGWVYARALEYFYQSRPVPIYGYGAIIGLPIVTFSILSYWDNYYRHRHFYRDRPRWEHRPYSGPPGFVPSPRPREPQYRPPRPVEPQYRPPRPVEPQFRPPRPVDPQYRPPRAVQPQAQPPMRPPGNPQGIRPGRGGERHNELRPPEGTPGGN